jgi:hypothetical protein
MVSCNNMPVALLHAFQLAHHGLASLVHLLSLQMAEGSIN